MSPSVCAVQCELRRTLERPIAVLTLDYKLRTATPRTLVLLGGLRAFATKASLDGGGPPALDVTAEGIVAMIDEPGEHTLSLTLETAIGSRGTKGELGIDVGLPRAAITSLSVTTDLKSLTLGTRWPDAAKPGELKSVVMETAKLKEFPLGPTDVLELSWLPPKATPPANEPSLDADIVVMVDDAKLETTATLKLRGPSREWLLTLPAGADLSGDAVITKPSDAKRREWKATLPANEGTLTVLVRQPRMDVKEVKTFPLGPFFVTNTRQTGNIRIVAAPTIKVTPRPAADVKRVDAVADEIAFRYAFAASPERKPVALMDLDVRPSTGFVVAQPTHKLSLTAQGWKLRTEWRIAPVRTAVEQVTMELPAGWQPPTVTPLDLVEEVVGPGDASVPRTLTVRLAAPQREPFVLMLDTRWLLPADARDVQLPLPRLQARERDVQVNATAAENIELNGSVRESDNGKLSNTPSDWRRVKPSSFAGSFDTTVLRADLSWGPLRGNATGETRADITIHEKHLAVSETIRMSVSDGVKTLALLGPAAAVNLRATPALDAAGPGEWTFTPPPGAKEVSINVNYALPVKAMDSQVAVPLLRPDGGGPASVRVWSSQATRTAKGFVGPWREVPPESSPERDSLPVLSLQGTGPTLPLHLDLADADPTGRVIVERAALQWWLGDDGRVQGRARFVLKRWPAAIDVEGVNGLTASVDRVRADVSPRGDGVRIPLPETRGKPLLLDLRFSAATDGWSATLAPPTLKGAVYRTPLWWQIRTPPEAAAFSVGGGLVPDARWAWNGFGFAPAAGFSSEDIDRWLNDSSESGVDRALTAKQTLPATVTLWLPPLWLMLLVVIGMVSTIGYALLRWRRPILMIAVAAILALSGVFWPQVAGMLAFLAQPALLLFVLVSLTIALWHGWQRQRATFIRSTAPSSPTIDLSTRSQAALP